MERVYKNKIHFNEEIIELNDEVFSVEEWENIVQEGQIWSDCGCGYWVKNNLASEDEVFSTPKLDATHVVWYNK